MVPDGARCCQPRCRQVLPDASRCCQVLPDAARPSQIPQMIPDAASPDAATCCQMLPGAARCFRLPSDDPRYCQMLADTTNTNTNANTNANINANTNTNTNYHTNTNANINTNTKLLPTHPSFRGSSFSGLVQFFGNMAGAGARIGMLRGMGIPFKLEKRFSLFCFLAFWFVGLLVLGFIVSWLLGHQYKYQFRLVS